jgi:hypothetical protein
MEREAKTRNKGCAKKAVARVFDGQGFAPKTSVLKQAVQHLALETDANLAEFRAEIRALNEVMVEKDAGLAAKIEKAGRGIDSDRVIGALLKGQAAEDAALRNEIRETTATADDLYHRLLHEGAAKEGAIEQARSWKQEARTQQGIVRDIFDALGLADVNPGFEVSTVLGRLKWKQRDADADAELATLHPVDAEVSRQITSGIRESQEDPPAYTAQVPPLGWFKGIGKHILDETAAVEINRTALIAQTVVEVRERLLKLKPADACQFAVVTQVSDAAAGDAGNLAVGEAYHVNPQMPMKCTPIAAHLALAFRVPVFVKGEILVLDAAGREVAGALRMPGKWDVSVALFDTVAGAIERAEKDREGAGS